jgi:hypothetical protein
MDKSDILNHDHLKETLTKKQERALKKIIKREEQIEKIKGEINEILNKNDLNVVDLDRFKINKKREEVSKLKFKFPKRLK